MLKFNYQKLKEARKLKNYTQQDMADRLQIDLHAYWRIEQGKTNLKVNHLLKLLTIFDKPLEYFTVETHTDDDIYIKIKDIEALLAELNITQIKVDHKDVIAMLKETIKDLQK